MITNVHSMCTIVVILQLWNVWNMYSISVEGECLRSTKRREANYCIVETYKTIRMKRNRDSRFAKDKKDAPTEQQVSQVQENLDYLNDDIGLFIAPSNSSNKPKRPKHDVSQMDDLSNRRDFIMKENLIEGLQSSIPETNKGFQLMINKFGFKLGSGLGKSETGMKDPIELHIPSDSMGHGKGHNTKSGIGVASIRKQRLKAILDLKEHLLISFQGHIRSKYEIRKLLRDIGRAARVLYELELPTEQFTHFLSIRVHSETDIGSHLNNSVCVDSIEHKGLGFAEVNFYHQNYKKSITHSSSHSPRIDTKNDDSQEMNIQQIELTLQLMQDRFLTFLADNQVSLISNSKLSDDSSLDRRDNNAELLETLSFILSDVLHHLRENFNYCLYCGVKYIDDKDMSSNCPGFLDEDH